MPILEKWTPFGELDVLDRRMRRLLAGVGVVPVPPADVYEAGGEYVVELEVPGYEKDELRVELVDHTLSVRGERREEKEATERTMRLHERLERTFERRFELPPGVDCDKLEACYAKGVLTLHLPRVVEARPRAIEITTSA